MDINKLIRNSDKVKEALCELPDGRLVCRRPVKIYIPVRFEERGLASIGIETNIIGIYAISVDDKYYGISLVSAFIKIEPTSTMKIDVDGVGYYEFSFEAGSTVISSLNLVRTDILIYRIYDEIISKARVPWYINYVDLSKLFDTAQYHAGANIGGNHEITELLVSLISRDINDRYKYYRQTVKSLADVKDKAPVYISLKSVTYAATNTVNKLAGSYYNTGVISALVSPSDRVEKLESLLLR